MSGHKIWTMWAFTVQAGSNKETILSGIVGNVSSGSFHPYQGLKVTTSRPVPQRFWPSLAYRLYGSATLILWSSASTEFSRVTSRPNECPGPHEQRQRRAKTGVSGFGSPTAKTCGIRFMQQLLCILIDAGNPWKWSCIMKKKHTVTTIIVSKKYIFFFNELKCKVILSLWPHLLH